MEQVYDEKTISDLYESLIKRMRSGERLSPLDQNLGVVTGHALDALELAKDIEHPLDLYELSEEKVSAVIIAMYMYFSKAGNSSTKCRETVTKKIGAYLFFAVCNVCNKNEGVEAAPAAKGSSLYLEVKEATGEGLFVDVFSPVERFIKNNLKYDKEAETMVIRDPAAIINMIMEQIPFV